MRTAAPHNDGYALAARQRAQSQAIKLARMRLAVIACAFSLACLLLSGRLIDLMLLAPPEAESAARNLDIDGVERGAIRDRRGMLLATSLPIYSVYADPALVQRPAYHAPRLAAVLEGVDAASIEKRLTAGTRFEFLKRHITPAEMRAVNALGVPGVGFRKGFRRVYPAGALTAHLIGTSDRDGIGTGGLEYALDHRLRKAPKTDVHLTIDLRLQHIVAEELQAGIDDFSAIGGVALVLDIASGDVLASAVLPGFDPHQPGDPEDERRKNHVVQSRFELGSVFKLITAALAMESGVAQPTDAFDARYPIRIGGHTIRDFKPEKRWLSMPEILLHSSNIGAAFMSVAAGRDAQQQMLHRLNLMSRLPIEPPAAAEPELPESWGRVHTMTIGYGHGIAVSPLHLAAAVAGLVSDEAMRAPRFVLGKGETGEILSDAPILSPHSRDMLLRMMRTNIAGSPVPDADPPGRLLGGKTGTAQKTRSEGGYGEDSRRAVFVGAFPISEPRYVLLAMIDEPQGRDESFGYATGGWVAAPVIGRITDRMAQLYGMAPIDETDPAIAEKLYLPLRPRSYMVAMPDRPGEFRRAGRPPQDSGRRAVRAAY